MIECHHLFKSPPLQSTASLLPAFPRHSGYSSVTVLSTTPGSFISTTANESSFHVCLLVSAELLKAEPLVAASTPSCLLSHCSTHSTQNSVNLYQTRGSRHSCYFTERRTLRLRHRSCKDSQGQTWDTEPRELPAEPRLFKSEQ